MIFTISVAENTWCIAEAWVYVQYSQGFSGHTHQHLNSSHLPPRFMDFVIIYILMIILILNWELQANKSEM